jgi:small-conductance mechanosensitive channel
MIGLEQITEQGMHITVRAWVKTTDFSSVFFDINASAAQAFVKANIPFAKS